MTPGAYHLPWSGLLHPVTCEHPSDCARAATHDRGGFRFCLGHFMLALQWEQPRVCEGPVEHPKEAAA